MFYKEKYLKYKNKYLKLKNQLGGTSASGGGGRGASASATEKVVINLYNNKKKTEIYTIELEKEFIDPSTIESQLREQINKNPANHSLDKNYRLELYNGRLSVDGKNVSCGHNNEIFNTDSTTFCFQLFENKPFVGFKSGNKTGIQISESGINNERCIGFCFDGTAVFDGLIEEGSFGNETYKIIKGNGTIQFDQNSFYNGDIKNDMFNGEGVRIFSDGYKEEGTFIDGQLNRGVKTSPDGYRLEGKFSDGILNGEGIRIYSNGTKEEGTFRNGKLNGEGIITSSLTERGTFINGELYRGVRTIAIGHTEEGIFENRDLHTGVKSYVDGYREEGTFINGQLNGKGVKTNPDGYTDEGTFENGQLNGKGVRNYSDGTKDEGTFRDGQLNGKGVRNYSDGTKEEGTFRDGEFTQKK